MDRKARRDHREPPAHLDRRDRRDRRALKVRRAPRDHLESNVRQGGKSREASGGEDKRRLPELRSELQDVAEQVRLAMDALQADALPPDALVQGLRAQEPIPPGPPVPLEPLASGGAASWLGEKRSERILLYCHGGGGVSGSVNGQRERAETLGALCRAGVYSVEYRLAPEHPYPRDIDDVVSAYRALLQQQAKPEKIAFAGQSHGAGLALSALLRLREEGEPLPAAAFLACGVYDRSVVVRDGFLEREVNWSVDDPILDNASFLRWLVETYLGGEDPSAPLASPLLADLSGLPPLLVQAGEMEVLRGQSERLVEAVRRAGGDATLDLEPEMFHNFHAYPLEAARAAVERAATFLCHHTR